MSCTPETVYLKNSKKGQAHTDRYNGQELVVPGKQSVGIMNFIKTIRGGTPALVAPDGPHRPARSLDAGIPLSKILFGRIRGFTLFIRIRLFHLCLRLVSSPEPSIADIAIQSAVIVTYFTAELKGADPFRLEYKYRTTRKLNRLREAAGVFSSQ